MEKFKKGDIIKFTFKTMEYPELIPSDQCLDTGLKIIGRGEIVYGPDSFSYYGVKVIEPDYWKGDNDLGGLLNGQDRGKGCLLHENAMLFEKAGDKNLNELKNRICSVCHSKMTQGAWFDWYCINNDCSTNQKNK